MSETARTGVPPASIYAHIGTSSTGVSDSEAEGRLRLRDDLRQPGGLLAAPLGILTLDAAASNVHRLAQAAPTMVTVHVFEPAHDVTELRIRGRVARQGRTQIYTEARISDARAPDRVVAFATTTFVATGPASAATPYDHGRLPDEDGTAPKPPLTEALGGRPRPDGGYVIPELTGARRLHSGVMQVMAEAASTEAVGRHTGASSMTELLTTTVMTEGRVGPFTVVPELLAIDERSAVCRVEVRDRGAGGRFVALITVRQRIASE